MAKTHAERQKLYRQNLLKNKSKYDQMRKISRIRDNKRRQNLNGDLLQQLRNRQKQASKKYRDRKKLERINNKQSSSYKSRQSFGKAVKRVLQSLPKDINRCVSVIHHIAQEFNIIPKTTSHHQREQRSLSIELKQLVMNFYSRDDISYQLPGKRDFITIKDDNSTSKTIQKRILLFSLREAHQLFLSEHDHIDAYLSLGSFSDLRPSNVLLQSHMTHRSCLCAYHENINLLIKPLSKYIPCPGLHSLQAFSSTLVCCETNEKCMFSKCSLCTNNLENKIITHVTNFTQSINWYQWVLKDGYSKKIEFNGTIGECIEVLKSKVNQFLAHIFIKRQQSEYFEKMKKISNNENICLQIDFSENFRLDIQDSVQNSYYSKVELTWNYFATSHGKGVVDGVGGTIKRLVYRAILSGQQCSSAAQFVKIAQSKTDSINVIELEDIHIENSKVKMEKIFQSIKTIPETKKIHSVKVLQNNTIEYKYYSNSSTKKTYRFLN
ncbi:unnamed protein product [Rotaria sordida]|uniref:Uncharacterized protein n=1 Tax=Rotaria sordida TaxID=392033 RepID=A0A813QFW7_9BILA|nr:unnamed protein product [Rotaria sordida]